MLLTQAQAAYSQALSSPRARPPRRSPVVKLGVTEADYKLLEPGPGAYSPTNPGQARSSAWRISDRYRLIRGEAVSPGPIYALKSSVDKQEVSNRPSAPKHSFGKQKRSGPALALSSPGPAAYSPRADRLGSPRDLLSADCPRASQLRALKPRDRAMHNASDESPGPAAYTPRSKAFNTQKHCYSMPKETGREGISFAVLPEKTPGPIAYNPASKSRYGGGHLGDAPAFSLSNSNHAKVFISKKHTQEVIGLASPGPATYTPREMMGVTNYTISNSSTHAPTYSFGTEARPCGEDPRLVLARITQYATPKAQSRRNRSPPAAAPSANTNANASIHAHDTANATNTANADANSNSSSNYTTDVNSNETADISSSSKDTADVNTNDPADANANGTADANANDTADAHSNASEIADVNSNETAEISSSSKDTADVNTNDTADANANGTADANANDTADAHSNANETADANSNDTADVSSNAKADIDADMDTDIDVMLADADAAMASERSHSS